MTATEITTEYATAFDALPPAYAAARGMVAQALSLARGVASSKPGDRCWCWCDSLKACAYPSATRVGGMLAEQHVDLALVLLSFERRDHQLHAHLHVEAHAGRALVLVGLVNGDSIGPWVAHETARLTAERAA